jgi:hypothetical protein
MDLEKPKGLIIWNGLVHNSIPRKLCKKNERNMHPKNFRNKTQDIMPLVHYLE